MMLYNPYDLIIIKENVIPQENIEELMLLTNNTKDISHATIINKDKDNNGWFFERPERSSISSKYWSFLFNINKHQISISTILPNTHSSTQQHPLSL